MMSEKKRYNDLNSHLRRRFGGRVQRVPIDAGFTCPNRDGTVGEGGCIYCSGRGAAAGCTDPTLSVEQQLQRGIESARNKYRADKFIAYFQAFTNTYVGSRESSIVQGTTNLWSEPSRQVGASPDKLVSRLKRIYQPALDHPDVVGIAIGTRPDCLPDEVIDLLYAIAETKLVWLEIGLQSAHDQTLDKIKRGHDYATFIDTVSRVNNKRKAQSIKCKTVGLELITHIILGLPGETREMMLKTARQISRIGLDGIKIHLLHVIKDTPLEQMYSRGELQLLERDEYVGLVCDVLELLPPDMVIHRLTGEAARTELVAPQWALEKSSVLSRIEKELERRETKQGQLWG